MFHVKHRATPPQTLKARPIKPGLQRGDRKGKKKKGSIMIGGLAAAAGIYITATTSKTTQRFPDNYLKATPIRSPTERREATVSGSSRTTPSAVIA